MALLLVRPFASRLLRPLLTSRSVSPRRPFSRKTRSPRVRTHAFTARPPDLRRLILDHESFAIARPLALIGTASYPVLVHRSAASIPASSPHSVALMQLRFSSLAVVNLWEDFHLQACAHAGRTSEGRPRNWRPQRRPPEADGRRLHTEVGLYLAMDGARLNFLTHIHVRASHYRLSAGSAMRDRPPV